MVMVGSYDYRLVALSVLISVPVMLLFVVLFMSSVNRVKRQRALLNELFEQAPEAVALMSVGNRVIRINREFTKVFGYAPREAVGRILDDLIVPDESRDEAQIYAKTVTHGRRVDAEGVRRRKDGSRLYVSIVGVPVSLPGGHSAVYAIYRDITERKRAEEALRQAQARIESVLSSVADVHILFDRDWRYLYINEAAVQSMGRPREQIIGRTLWEIFPDIVGTEVDRQYHRAMDERLFVNFDFHYLTTDTWWENRFYPAPEGLSVFATDITERKRAEEKLRQSESQLAEAQRLAHIGSWNWDLQSNVLSWSDELYRIFGVDPHAFNPAYEEFVTEFVHPQDRALVRDIIESSIKAREPFSFYNRIFRPDGEERVIHARGDIVSDEHGKPIRMFGTAQDVTERKRAEEKLRETTEQLRALSASLQSVREEEGTRIAREIHDELGSALAGLRWELESLDKAVSESGEASQLGALREKIETMIALTDTTVAAVRRISSELRPSILDDLGLAEAIEWQAQQ
ncbi:MAG: hypothetical protein DMF65_01205, partial [Acidobacteria bacterium]